MVVEDDEASGAFARAVLEESGYRVVLASSGSEGLAAFRREQPRCVLLDARMPFVDGYETCCQLRAIGEGAEVPIIFMTGERSVDSFDRAFACGADDFLTKPVSPNDLIDRVHAGMALWRVRASRDHSLVKGQRDQLVRHQLQQERLNLLLVHDLKAPLNAISLLAQGMLRGKDLSGPNREMLEEIWQQARSMAGMVLDLLDVGKAREGRLMAHLETVDLREMVEQLVLGFQALSHSRGVELQSSVFIHNIEADKKLLKRLLANLIDNALEHAPRGSTIQIVASPRPGSAEIRVADAGAGIPAQLRDRVFEAFSQDAGAGGDHRGLGLTFCRLAADAHGGRIWIEDGAPGCVMCVAIPLGGVD
ncbi:MAG TPA: hybrid sensor histidine kinase/response regulator [Polyangiaceae bacterium]|nr:hybrid sensor histidine kinase/response regulator [Polyangiaceae bacterium]